MKNNIGKYGIQKIKYDGSIDAITYGKCIYVEPENLDAEMSKLKDEPVIYWLEGSQYTDHFIDGSNILAKMEYSKLSDYKKRATNKK